MLWNIQVLPCQLPNYSIAANRSDYMYGDAVSVSGNRSKCVPCLCQRQTVHAQTANTQRGCCATSSESTSMLLFWLLELCAGQIKMKEGTSGLFLQICVHASKCVHLTHQGVCPIWSVLVNFILLCLHGKRSKVNIETRVMACFALLPNCLTTGQLWGAAMNLFGL